MAPKKTKSANAVVIPEAPERLLVFLEIGCRQDDGSTASMGRLVFQLAHETHPRTCENFKLLCQGTPIPADKKPGKDQRVFSYQGTPFTRITVDGIQGGNIHRNIDAPPAPLAGGPRSLSPVPGGAKGVPPEVALQSIYGAPFEDENKGAVEHHYGSLSMCNAGPNTNGCQFFVCTVKNHPTNLEVTQSKVAHLNRHYVAFGTLVEGADVLAALEAGLTGEVTSSNGFIQETAHHVLSCGIL